MELRYHISRILRRLPLVVAFAIFGATLGLWIAAVLPPTYRSEAVLIVESQQIPDELAASTVQTGEIESLQIIRQRILTRQVLIDLANRLGIYDGVDAAAQMSVDDRIEDLRNRIRIETVGGAASRRGPTQATIVDVNFEAPTAALAARVANEVVTLILQENVEMRTTVASQTLDFFTQEVEQLEQRLSEISAQMLDFQESNLEALPDSLDFRRSQQAALQERLLQLDREETALGDRRDQLRALFEETGRTEVGSGSGAAGTARATPREERLQQLREEYAALAAVLSEDNPRLAMLRSRIAAIERAPAETPLGPGGADAPDPAAAFFELQVADIVAQLAHVADQRGTIETRMADLARTIAATPGNAITLASLEREYANLQIQYNQAVANRARAETGSTIEALSKGRRITMVEQAVPPASPARPNRPLIVAAGSGAGLLAGIGLVLLLELLNAAIRRPKDLQNALGIDTLATIPYLPAAGKSRRRWGTRGTVALVLAVAVPAGLWALDPTGERLRPVAHDLLWRIDPAALPRPEIQP